MIAFCICRHEQIPQMLRRETIMWKHLKHPKISPLLVVSVSQLRVIFGWVSGGELLDYIKKNAGTGLLALVRVPPVAVIAYLLRPPVLRDHREPRPPPLVSCG